jgi:hypothetical protein
MNRLNKRLLQETERFEKVPDETLERNRKPPVGAGQKPEIQRKGSDVSFVEQVKRELLES